MPWCRLSSTLIFFFFNDTATTEIYTLSLYDALPISDRVAVLAVPLGPQGREVADLVAAVADVPGLGDELDLADDRDRKSTRLNSSHANISYAGFCLKKKKATTTNLKRNGGTAIRACR